MTSADRDSAAGVAPDPEQRAAESFASRRFGAWTAENETELRRQLEQDPLYADAFLRVEQSWAAVGEEATSAELMELREQALSRARRTSARRWMGRDGAPRLWRTAASVAALGIALASAYQFAPFGLRPGEYQTTIAEQRSIELADHTRIALDAATRLRVRYSEESRVVQLVAGQAQFFVAKDPARPFKVQAGGHTVVAVGTVFTVDYADHDMQVAMLEGKVVVLPNAPALARMTPQDSSVPQSAHAPAAYTSRMPQPSAHNIELVAGEALRVLKDGRSAVIPNADLEAATAWREGKVIFHSEPLGEAVRRLNRYTRQQLQIEDAALAAMNISGIFDANDTAAFIEAVQFYLPVTAEHTDGNTIRLKAR